MDPRVYDSELHGRNRTAKTHLRIVQRYLRPGRVLDVGCASGLFLFHEDLIELLDIGGDVEMGKQNALGITG